MAIVFALITSGLWGTGDFFGGLAARQLAVARVMLWVHGIGLIAVAAVAPFIADEIIGYDLALGAVGGLVGLAGGLLLYWSLAAGPMSIVAPLAGLSGALLPVAWGLLFDDEGLASTTAAGLVLGLAAVVAMSWQHKDEPAASVAPSGAVQRWPVFVAAVAGGACLGSLVLIYDATSEASAPWPVVSGRVVSTAALLVYLCARRVSLRPGTTLGFTAVAGLSDTAAMVMLLFATSAAVGSAQLSTVAVVSAFYPAATVVWARFKLHEPLGRVRFLGLGLALAAIALMTL